MYVFDVLLLSGIPDKRSLPASRKTGYTLEIKTAETKHNATHTSKLIRNEEVSEKLCMSAHSESYGHH